jgi:hypothetical protein
LVFIVYCFGFHIKICIFLDHRNCTILIQARKTNLDGGSVSSQQQSLSAHWHSLELTDLLRDSTNISVRLTLVFFSIVDQVLVKDSNSIAPREKKGLKILFTR